VQEVGVGWFGCWRSLVKNKELMKRTKMSKSGGYKQALLEYHAKLTQSTVIR